MKDLIIQSVTDTIDLAVSLYPQLAGLEYPTISFKLRGSVAGYAHRKKDSSGIVHYGLKFNLTCLTEDNYQDVTKHEVAHFIAWNVHKGKRIKPHGIEWRTIAIALGDSGERCHNYKTVRARKYTPQKRYSAYCNCIHAHIISATKYNRIVASNNPLHKGTKYKCIRCNTFLTV